ncbi:DUF2793 domain-containing protein [Sedimentimonas flavescens]|uniref:DUF2793 domain-containing protein n=1 Tax=Sedimentimonas flavescens TaxID=2851012 RepID=UPI0021A26C23|nr:DUF2793 domain-containing protein [Sedimentimonas flavescens]MCT2539649.1 DUF2793 domain-containing protein [Sedimentimonas flavescens]
MTDTSAILGLPYIMPSQAQKHVTHNEALRHLDVIVQLAVVAFDATTPPAVPVAGTVHALGPGATGAWAGQVAGTLAAYLDGVWNFFAPQDGWIAAAGDDVRAYAGGEWVRVGATQMLEGLGIGTTSDATNRLSVAADATLLSHAGAGHQLKLNKAGSGDTCSLLFQSNWAGHAEMGLVGDTDFAIKTSADGVSFTPALRLNAASGIASGAAVQSGRTDATEGRLMAVGAFGLGSMAAPGVADLDATDLPAGFYGVSQSATGTFPAGLPAGSGAVMEILRYSTDFARQILRPAFAAGAVWERLLINGVWGAWRQVGLPAMLGTVSQSGGVPTGAVVERGSNTNGEYVRWADGTQICTRTVTGMAVSTAAGAIWTSGSQSASFAMPFAATPVGSGSVTSSANAWVNARATSATQWGFSAFATGSLTGQSVALMATGRWF